MRFVGCEFRLVVELTVDHDVDIVAELVGLAIASNLEPPACEILVRSDRPSIIWSMWALSLAVNKTM